MCYLSIILPAHNEETRLPNTLESISSYLKCLPFDAEVIIVENASTDRTFEIAKDFTLLHPEFQIIQEKRKGKGRAVKTGMLNAKGKYRLFSDVDLSVSIEEIIKFIPPINNSPISIASREALGAIRYNEPFKRHLMGRIFNIIVSSFLLPGLKDTQCGFKCFSAQVVEKIFPLQTIEGWSFDIEVLFIAKQLGYTISEVPVQWYYKDNSKINPMKDSLNMLSDILKIKRNDQSGLYLPK